MHTPSGSRLLTLGAHAQRGLQYLGLCLCVYGASVRPENAVKYSAGNEGQNILWGFASLASQTARGRHITSGPRD